MNLLIEYQYFPSVILFNTSFNFSNIVFEQYEFYQKMGFRNRCRIAGANGVIDLSIPLENGRDQKAFIRDVKIAGSHRWQAAHWKSILSCYNRSPWFEFYRDSLEKLYRRPFVFLVDWDLECFEWALESMEIKPGISFTETFRPVYEEIAWKDWRNKIRPGNLEELPAVKYRQVFEDRLGFLPNLSILDLLFCEGKRARQLLQDPVK